MSRKTIIGIVGLIVVFVFVGIAFANSYEFGHCKINSRFGKFAFHNMTGESNKFYKHLNITNFTESLGLPENATHEEIKNALKEKMEIEREQLIARVKEKLGLSKDATDEDVKNALNQWREENIDLIEALMHNKMFGHRFFKINHR